jgi:hypothetical protein
VYENVFQGKRRRYHFKGGRIKMRRGLALTTLALGAAYMLRNDKSRQKLKDQFLALGESSRRRR